MSLCQPLQRPLKVGVLSAHEGSDAWRALLQTLERTGTMRVRSVSGFSDDVYRHAKSRLQRLSLRFRTFVAYPLSVIARRRALAREFDALIVITSPFFLPALVTRLVRGPRIVVLQNDIYPEALIVRRMIARGGALDRFLTRIIIAGLERAAAVVYIADEHRAHVVNVMKARSNDVVIPVPSHLTADPRGLRAESEACLTALYQGTLGLMHETATFLRFLDEGGLPAKVRFVFRTGGAGKAVFEQEIRARAANPEIGNRVVIGDGLPDADWTELMRSSEIGMVFQSRGAGDVVFPSKAASILVAGQAVLAIAESDSALGRLVIEHDCGWVIVPGDAAQLRSALAEAATPEILQRKRRNAYALGMSRFAVGVVADQWQVVLTAPAERPPALAARA